jgi:hypothetical protein
VHESALRIQRQLAARRSIGFRELPNLWSPAEFRSPTSHAAAALPSPKAGRASSFPPPTLSRVAAALSRTRSWNCPSTFLLSKSLSWTEKKKAGAFAPAFRVFADWILKPVLFF